MPFLRTLPITLQIRFQNGTDNVIKRVTAVVYNTHCWIIMLEIGVGLLKMFQTTFTVNGTNLIIDPRYK